MDIEILNEAQVDSTCNQALTSYIPQLNNEISNLSNILSQVKNKWQSNGMDQQSYILELEKQIRNLTKIESAMKQLFTTISNYSGNVKKISSNTVDAVIGGNYKGYNVDAGYTTAHNAVTSSNPKTILNQYVNENSTIKSFAKVNSDGSVGEIVSAKGTSLNDYAAKNNIGLDQIAVDIGKNGKSQVWVSAEDLLN